LPTFNKPAVDTLVDLGADVNPVDDKGISCLIRAGDDVEMIKLLIRHGAVLTQPAMIEAIKKKNLEVLEALLSHGADPNMREGIERRRRRTLDETLKSVRRTRCITPLQKAKKTWRSTRN